MNEPVSIFIDKETNKNKPFIVFKFENGHEYDPAVEDTKQDWWLDHMREKIWFTKDIEERTINLLKTL